MAVWYPVESWKASGELDRLRGVFNAGIENDLGHPNNVVRQSAQAHRILCDEFQKCRIAKIVPAFEGDVLMHKIRMLIQAGSQTRYVTCKIRARVNVCFAPEILKHEAEALFSLGLGTKRHARTHLSPPSSA